MWLFLKPVTGSLCWNNDDQELLCYGQSWIRINSNQSNLLGVGTEVDEFNRFSIKSLATSFDNEGGDHRLVLTKMNRQMRPY